MGSDPSKPRSFSGYADFNPRSRMGSDYAASVPGITRPRLFQSTLPHGERLRAMTAAAGRCIFQSTLPHGERLPRLQILAVGRISIHAPAWGATVDCDSDSREHEFQSTLPHGERQSGCRYGRSMSKFQSTLPHGERRYREHRSCAGSISIHAPAWGATPRSLQSAPRLFQSTLPHGERLQRRIYESDRNFNPRSRMGSDAGRLRTRHERYFNPRSRMGSDVWRQRLARP